QAGLPHLLLLHRPDALQAQRAGPVRHRLPAVRQGGLWPHLGPGAQEDMTRARLAALWVSQASRVLADGCLRLIAMLAWAGTGAEGRLSAWHLATAVFI